MPKATASAAAGGLSMPNDLHVLGRHLAFVHERGEECDRLEKHARASKDPVSATYFASARDFAYDEWFAAREAITWTRAGDLTGAAIQVAEAILRVEVYREAFPEKEETPQARDDYKAIVRLLFSVLLAVDARADVKLAEATYPGYGSENVNPWVDVESRLAGVKDAAA